MMTYNDVGAVTSLTYPDGETLSSNFDNNGYLRSLYFGTVSNSDPVSFLVGQVSYTNSGQLAGFAIGGTAAKTSVPTTPIFSTMLGYDDIQRLITSSATLGGASTPFWSQSRTLDNVGNVLQLSSTVPTTSGSSLTDNQSFCYDALGRLMWAGNGGTPSGGDHCGSTPGGSTTSGYTQSFSYDAIDRMLVGSAGTESYGDASHVHAATDLSSIPNQYASYDAMGNMICRNTDSSGSQSCAAGSQTGATMSYDNEGRLASWTASNGISSSDQFLYDNEGKRVLQRTSTTPVGSNTPTIKDTITFDGFTEVRISGNTTTTTNYYGVAGHRVAMRKGAILSYLLPDFLGSDTIALNYDGSIQSVQLFTPYGQVRYSDQIMPTDYSFTGQRLDSMTGLLYYNARYYDPVSGRFISADTVQNNTTGMDPYAYVGDNPETKTDPTGHAGDPGDTGTILVGAWYQLLHPGQKVVVDSYDFTIPNAAVFPYGTTNWRQHIQSQYGYPGEETAGHDGRPDIVNVTSKVMWEVKTGKPSTNFPSLGTRAYGQDQVQWYVERENYQRHSQWWQFADRYSVGDRTNDSIIGDAMLLCKGACRVSFSNGAQMLIGNAVPGVLEYKYTQQETKQMEPRTVVATDVVDTNGQSVLTQLQILSAGLDLIDIVSGALGAGTQSAPASEPAPVAEPVFAVGGGGCSFTPETRVDTTSGVKEIGQLIVGEQVLSYNPITHQMEAQSILHVWRHVDHDLIDVTVLIPSNSVQQRHSIEEVLHTTSEHPFLTLEENFVPAGRLAEGLHLLNADGNVGVVTQVKRIRSTQTMYNLEVANDHTFAVGAGLWIVHNMCVM